MRLKLVFFSALVASLVGAGSAVAIVSAAFASLKPLTSPSLLVFATYLLPLLTTLLAAIFVYRHTARRRKLQAALTAIASLIFCLTIFMVASIITVRGEPIQPEPVLPRNVG